HDLGTAVNVQTMVFGNMGNDSGTGVAFTRDPNTGEKVLYGDYLANAQGEDVVAGIRTPQPISSLKKQMPDVYKEFETTAHRRVEPPQAAQVLHPRIDPKAKPKVIAKGIDASPGAASGKAVFDADRAEEK